MLTNWKNGYELSGEWLCHPPLEFYITLYEKNQAITRSKWIIFSRWKSCTENCQTALNNHDPETALDAISELFDIPIEQTQYMDQLIRDHTNETFTLPFEIFFKYVLSLKKNTLQKKSSEFLEKVAILALIKHPDVQEVFQFIDKISSKLCPGNRLSLLIDLFKQQCGHYNTPNFKDSDHQRLFQLLKTFQAETPVDVFHKQLNEISELSEKFPFIAPYLIPEMVVTENAESPLQLTPEQLDFILDAGLKLGSWSLEDRDAQVDSLLHVLEYCKCPLTDSKNFSKRTTIIRELLLLKNLELFTLASMKKYIVLASEVSETSPLIALCLFSKIGEKVLENFEVSIEKNDYIVGNWGGQQDRKNYKSLIITILQGMEPLPLKQNTKETGRIKNNLETLLKKLDLFTSKEEALKSVGYSQDSLSTLVVTFLRARCDDPKHYLELLTMNVGTGFVNPFKTTGSLASTSIFCSTSSSWRVLSLIKTCIPLASEQRRAARLTLAPKTV